MPTFIKPRDVVLHYAYSPGADKRRPVVFANSLGTDLRIWDGVLDHLPADLPCLRMDKRGHGLSGSGPIDMDSHVGDLADLMDALGLSRALICGVSVGGMIAQGLAARRPDLVAGLLLSNTGARIGSAETWNARIGTVERDGIAAMAEAILERWFAPSFHAAHADDVAGYRNMLVRISPEGYAGTCAAIRDTDFTEIAQAIAMPAICLAGAEDGATPPDVVRSLADLIPGAEYHLLDGVGHLPCIEAPRDVAALLRDLHGRLA